MARKKRRSFVSRIKPGALVTTDNKVLPCLCTVIDPHQDPWKVPRRVELGAGEAALVVEKHSRSIGKPVPFWVLLIRGEFAFVDELELRELSMKEKS